MTDELRTLVRYRLEQADSALQAAEKLVESGLWRDSVNRAYYAAFYAVEARQQADTFVRDVRRYIEMQLA
jgi:uncharacterized protein (UPF0332 family)